MTDRQKAEETDDFKTAWEEYNPRGNAGGWEKVAFTCGFGKGFAAGLKARELELEKYRWIPVSERLPEEDAPLVMAYVDEEKMRVWSEGEGGDPAMYEDGNQGVIFANVVYVRHWAKHSNWLTHWMPLPEAPKEGQ